MPVKPYKQKRTTDKPSITKPDSTRHAGKDCPVSFRVVLPRIWTAADSIVSTLQGTTSLLRALGGRTASYSETPSHLLYEAYHQKTQWLAVEDRTREFFFHAVFHGQHTLLDSRKNVHTGFAGTGSFVDMHEVVHQDALICSVGFRWGHMPLCDQTDSWRF